VALPGSAPRPYRIPAAPPGCGLRDAVALGTLR